MLSDYPARYWSDLSAVQLKLETAFGASSVPPKAVHSAATSRHPLQLGRAGVNVLEALELRNVLGALRRIAFGVTVLSRSCKLSLVHDQVLVADWPLIEETFQDFAYTGCIARLGGESRSGDVGCHCISLHPAPWVVRRRWLWEPNVASVAGQVAFLACFLDCLCITDLSTSCVDQVCPALHRVDHLFIEKVLSLRMKRAIDGDHVASLDQ
mmetsp:Transcript_126962/g.179133  ORF Transcript_126962/g.179133 Transcript_126962/m.179133 type:complete len:211 (-) Transcript_126962:825-1457(-)